MWKFLLDPVIQAIFFLIAVGALAFVAWDLYDEARNPSPTMAFSRRRREPPASEPPASGPPRGRTRVEASVEVWTDAQGDVHGSVLRGPCQARRLEELSREECEAQAAYCREHDPAAAVGLDAYIRFRFGPRRRHEAPRPEGGMTRAAAFAELGLGEGASEAQVHAAWRAMIKQHHPDHGGSHARAARINQAKAVLEG
jgi:hypothetical protein